jgi:hypothetical protein
MNFRFFSQSKSLPSKAWLVAVLLLLFIQTGCGYREKLPYHRVMAPFPTGQVCRVAVLPFANDSDFPLGDVMVKKVVMAELQEKGDYQVLQEGDITKTYQQLRIYPGRMPSLEQMQIVADRLDAEILITGVVLEMREDPWQYATINPKIVMEIQIRDGRNGEILWIAYHNRQGTDYTKTMHFGTIHSLAGLSRQMVQEIITLWYEKGLPQCTVFSQP